MKFQKLKTSLKNHKPPEFTGICDPAKLHLPQRQFSILEGKTFQIKVLNKLHRTCESNFSVHGNLILFSIKKILKIIQS